jgi:hypothetical protein
MITKIKLLRVQIDGLAQLTKELKPNKGFVEYNISMEANVILFPGNTKEIEKAHDSLILAKAWLGKILGELGNPTPYQNNGKRTDVNSIEPTADVAVTNYGMKGTEKGKVDATKIGDLVLINENWYDKNHIEKVDWLRQEVDKILSNQLSMEDYTPEEQHLKEAPATGKECWYETKYQECLIEARFWLGFELQRIRETELTK